MRRDRAVEISDLIRQQVSELPRIVPNSWRRRVLYALLHCRTAAMGGHIDRCDNTDCRRVHISYNSCRNRHCPKCQGHLREKWVMAREAEILNTSYFHVVFTLPDHLNEMSLRYPRILYRILFRMAWSVIRDFGCNPKLLGARTGMIAVLHTWGQNLSLHPHLHCIVPAGGITAPGKWKASRAKGKYLFPVKEMKRVFRARYVAALRKELEVDAELSNKLFEKPWVIYCKRPFQGPKQVIGYLGNYTHRIAISNNRIMTMEDDEVTFRAKDYRHGGKRVMLHLSTTEFIRRFALHVLPKGFTRIRHYGILSSSSKKHCRALIEDQIGKPALTGTDKPSCHRVCPVCKKGTLITLIVFDERGPPAGYEELLKCSKIKE